MKTISSNIKGINSKRKQRPLWKPILEEDLDVFMLQETKCGGEEAEHIFSHSWKKGQNVILESRGLIRGLAILWNLNKVILPNFFTTHRSIPTTL